jgi:thymidylate synthase (FAD)
MPHNKNLEPKKHPFRVLFGQRPLTCFKDYRKSIKVELIKYDDRESMLRGTYDFVKATWSEDGRESERASESEMQDALKAMLSGKALGLGLETVNFMFKISGITRIDTHQIVRQRIGVTFSQQCTGDRFLNHNDVLVEESIAKYPDILERFIDSTLKCKMCYSRMVDSLDISIQAARSILPHNLETFIFMNTNLATLLFFYQKRIDDGSQTWQMNEISRQMADEVCRVFPELSEVFEKNKSKFKLQREASADRKNTFSTSLYVPNVDEFDYHERDFLYQKKKNEMNFTNTPIEDRYYWGFRRISKEMYDEIKKAYSLLDKAVHEGNYSNEEILEMGRKITSKFEHE